MTRSAGGWDGYWRATLEAAAHREGGPQEEVLARFWTTLFTSTLPHHSHPRLLDVACGNGAIARYVSDAAQHLGSGKAGLFGLDRSAAALVQLRRRFPSVNGVVADARHAPFQDGAFDFVASQFGVEYAGIDAIGEAARLVAPHGVFAAILHLRDGGIFRECTVNLRAIERMRDTGFLGRAKQLFRTGSDGGAVRRAGTALGNPDAEFALAVKEVEIVLRDYGKDVAGGVVYQLYTDVAHMYSRTSAYEPREAIAWLDQMTEEIATYIDRMSAMLDAAIGECHLDQSLQLVAERGLVVRLRDTLRMGSKNEPAAWVLVCDRR